MSEEKNMTQQIIEVLKDVKGDLFEEENNLVSSGFISSFEIIEVVSELENSFEIKIPLERTEPERLDSVEEIKKLINDCKTSHQDEQL